MFIGGSSAGSYLAALMIKYAKQAESEIIYKEYPGTHGTFGKDKKKQEDFARFILERSGTVEPSGIIGDK